MTPRSEQLRELADRICSRSPIELKQTIIEFGDLLSNANDGVIAICSQKTEFFKALGKCLVEWIEIHDPLLGERSFRLRVFEFETLVESKLYPSPIERYRELVDDAGAPILFDQMRDAHRVLVEAIRHHSRLLDDARELRFYTFTPGDSLVNRSTLKRNVESGIDYLRKVGHGTYEVREDRAHLYIKPTKLGLLRG